jgi:uncharacterized membrane protein
MDERHPWSGTTHDWLRSATLGFAGGLRSTMPFAVVASYLGRQGPDIADGGWAVDLLSSRWGGRVLTAAALVEVGLDKTTIVPSRVAPGPLAGRIVSSGVACALEALSEGRTSDSGALLGSLGAVLGSVVGYTLRTRLPLPGLALAFAEDALAFNLARWAVQH